MKKLKNKKIVIPCCVLLAALIIGLTIAFLTDFDSAKNILTIGSVDVELVEPNYPPDPADRILVPYGTVKKDPVIANTGTTDSIVFIEITAPLVDSTAILSDRSKGTSDYREVFKTNVDDSSQTAAHGLISYNKNWVFLSENTDTNAHTKTYLFGYSAVISPNAKTAPLFDSVSLISILESSTEANTTASIVAQGYAIQSSNIDGVDPSAPLDYDDLMNVFTIISQQRG